MNMRRTTRSFWQVSRGIFRSLPGVGVVFVVLLCPEMLLAEGTTVAASLPFRVATFNLLHGGVYSGLTGDDQDLERRLAMAAMELQKNDVDIIGIQEASSSRGRGNTAARLAAQLRFHYVYAPASFRIFASERLNTFISWLMNFSEGPAIVSRFPITNWFAHDLPRCGRFTDPRVLLTATLHTPWGSLLVASTHTSGDPCQHGYVAEVLRRTRGDLPVLVMGDFNAAEHSPAMAMFTPEQGFIDAFRALNRSLPGSTCYQHPYASTRTVTRRIDYLFVIPGKATLEHVHYSRVFLDTPQPLPNGQMLWPSDHYGVVAELSLLSLQRVARPQ